MESSAFEEALFRQHQQESQHRFTLETGLFIAILFGAFMAGINNLNYNTLFLDETINANIGEDLLHGIFTRNAMTFHFGSYLYPFLSALLNKAGGITALRLTSTIMMCVAVVFIYFTTRHLFGHKAALFGMLLFSFSGVILNLGQLAVYDSLALPFLAGSFFFLVGGAKFPDKQKPWFLTASLFAALAVLSKYIGLIYLPALFLTGLALLRLKGMPLRQALSGLTLYFLFPVFIVLSLYVSHYFFQLIRVFEQQGFSPGPRSLILKILFQEIGLILVLALAGLSFLVLPFRKDQNDSTSSAWFSPANLSGKSLSRSRKIVYLAAALFLISTWLAAPLSQWMTGNIRSLWKNCAYSLIFLVPLAGYCLASVVEKFRSTDRRKDLIGVLCMCLGVIYFVNQSLNANWSFHQSWPNVTGVTTYLKQAGLNQNSRVLAEGMDIYEYYLDFGAHDRQGWNNFWYMDYGGKSGQEGALAAILDRVPDFVIIDDYYLPGIRARATPILEKAGYVVGWQETQKLRSGETILVQVFIPGRRGSQ